MVQGLGLGAFTAVAPVRSLVRELRSCKPHSMAKKKEKKRQPGSLVEVYLWRTYAGDSNVVDKQANT